MNDIFCIIIIPLFLFTYDFYTYGDSNDQDVIVSYQPIFAFDKALPRQQIFIGTFLLFKRGGV